MESGTTKNGSGSYPLNVDRPVNKAIAAAAAERKAIASEAYNREIEDIKAKARAKNLEQIETEARDKQRALERLASKARQIEQARVNVNPQTGESATSLGSAELIRVRERIKEVQLERIKNEARRKNEERIKLQEEKDRQRAIERLKAALPPASFPTIKELPVAPIKAPISLANPASAKLKEPIEKITKAENEEPARLKAIEGVQQALKVKALAAAKAENDRLKAISSVQQSSQGQGTACSKIPRHNTWIRSAQSIPQRATSASS